MPVRVQNKLFIHMPKTGGTWVTRYLKAEHEGQQLGKHGHVPARMLKPHELKDCLLWGTIRDPWSWYASWYAHGMQSKHYQERLAVYGGGSLDFKDVLMGALSSDKNRCPERVAAIWSIADEASARRDYLQGLGGLYSWAFRHIYGNEVKTLVDMKQLSSAMRELFRVDVDEQKYPPFNIREYINPPDSLYDDELAEAVYEADKDLIEKLRCKPFGSFKTAVLRI